MSEQATTRTAAVPFEYETRNLVISVNVSDLRRISVSYDASSTGIADRK